MVAHARLVVSELATNAVRHAGTPFRVSLGHRDGVAHPGGPGLRGSSADPPPGVDPAADGGRGLVIVSALSDSWGVTPCPDGGKEVWARFLIHAG